MECNPGYLQPWQIQREIALYKEWGGPAAPIRPGESNFGVVPQIGLFIASFFPVSGEAIDGVDCARGSKFSCVALPMPVVSGRIKGPFNWLSTALNRSGDAPTSALDDAVRALCSFDAETRVLMADGSTKPIAEVEVGDWVLAEDPETGGRGPRAVTHLWVHQDNLLDLEIDGHAVTTTEDHPFWNHTDGEWQRADVLDPGDMVLTADGATRTVDGIDSKSARTATAYNLTVDDIHTYFVMAGEAEILVHNQCGELLSDQSSIASRFGMSRKEVNKAIHALKTDIPSGAPVRNPDVVVDAAGEVFPKIPGGGLGDSLGNILDDIPGANQ